MDQTQRHQLASQISQGKLDPRTLSEEDQVEVLGYVMFHHSLFKGESEGHPFRGNQYTEGQRVSNPTGKFGGEAGQEGTVERQTEGGDYVVGLDGEGPGVFTPDELEPAEEKPTSPKAIRRALGNTLMEVREDDRTSLTYDKVNGTFTVRNGFFYSSGRTSQNLVDSVSKQLDEAGIKYQVVDHGTRNFPFKGGAPISKQSHWWVEIRGDGSSLKKGEAKGHPFRGNQYTDAAGGSLEESADYLDGLTSDELVEEYESALEGDRPDKEEYLSMIEDRAAPGSLDHLMTPSGEAWDPKSHPMYTPEDYTYFHDKGYTDEEIKAFWDRDHAEGAEPVTTNKNQYRRDKKINDLTQAFISEHPTGEGLYEHLASQGFDADEVDTALNQAHQDYIHNRHTPNQHQSYLNNHRGIDSKELMDYAASLDTKTLKAQWKEARLEDPSSRYTDALATEISERKSNQAHQDRRPTGQPGRKKPGTKYYDLPPGIQLGQTVKLKGSAAKNWGDSGKIVEYSSDDFSDEPLFVVDLGGGRRVDLSGASLDIGGGMDSQRAPKKKPYHITKLEYTQEVISSKKGRNGESTLIMGPSKDYENKQRRERRKSKRASQEKQIQDIMDAQKIEQENFLRKISLIKG